MPVASLVGEKQIKCTARGVEDESCGYHPHHTVWDWSAGVGTTHDGKAVAWNLVSGINDPPRGSERAIWLDEGAPQVAVMPNLDLKVRGTDGVIRTV